MGAGILPVALYKGTLYILLGQERYNSGLWSDFGGSAHKYEKPFKTAIREGTEELNGFLGSEEDMEKEVTQNMILTISYGKYTTYIYRTRYNSDLPKYFENNNKFIESQAKYLINDNENGLYEKITIGWFPINKFVNEQYKSMLRPHYLPHINSIIKNNKTIIKHIEEQKF
jgi:hypothetical protein|tara:strand:+ start:7016 stop:7528 length:513 start_codon:yes stop_codon:yes gene_type:complete